MSPLLVWMDLEMTGLDPDREVIQEIATVVTDSSLAEVAVGPVLALSAAPEKLADMDEWNQTHHSQSGLLDRVRASDVDVAEAESATLSFLKRHIAAQTSPLCGNTIWQDRRFLARHMPQLEQFLHYRNLDVSSIKELARHWRPDLLQRFKKKNEHRALADIRESIAELAFYRREFFTLEEPPNESLKPR